MQSQMCLDAAEEDDDIPLSAPISHLQLLALPGRDPEGGRPAAALRRDGDHSSVQWRVQLVSCRRSAGEEDIGLSEVDLPAIPTAAAGAYATLRHRD
ncbi:hypothetical protein EJB05_40147 [Eragrostis curvula]|uniref:Uncharacterized protein n=1 Tax=Eragrostis curvula TaxID=38414 RepID=A0A5J9TZ15_9POAL|nr:hypothetical protein EJB05_40147 [Eragrostis curvula]